MYKNEQHWRLGWCIFPFLSWTMVADVTPHVTATRWLKNQWDKIKFFDNRVRFLFKKIHHLQGRDPAKIPTVLMNLFTFLQKISPHGCRRIAFCPARYFLSHPVYDTPLAFSVLQKNSGVDQDWAGVVVRNEWRILVVNKIWMLKDTVISQQDGSTKVGLTTYVRQDTWHLKLTPRRYSAVNWKEKSYVDLTARSRQRVLPEI